MWSILRSSAALANRLGSGRPLFNRIIKFNESSSSRVAGARNEPVAEEEGLEKFKLSLDDENRRRLETYMAEYEIFKYADSRMPSRMAVKSWSRMLQMETKMERIQYLSYLYEVERLDAKDEADKLRSQEKADVVRETRRAEIKRQTDEHIYYGVGGCSIFQRIMDMDMNQNMNSKLASAMVLGPHIIFDMSFYPAMRPMETSLTSKQLLLVHRDNRLHRFPHHIIFSGCRRSHASWQDVQRQFGEGDIDSRMYTVTEKHYLDLFPKEQLVYLSPDAKIAISEYDAEKVYIVGALVDRMAKPNMTLGRAKEEGIEARRLPFERCIRLVGGKSLCLNHIIQIMNDAYADGSITTAMLNRMPKRKVVSRKSDMPRKKQEFYKQRLNYLRSLGPVE